MIYLIRHGLDDENYIGGYSNIGLIDEGIKQIETSSIWLKENIKDINKIYTSDVKRAIESSNIINKYFNFETEVTKDLRELDKGLLNGMEKEKAKQLYPEYIEVNDINKKYPNGEAMLDLYKRIKLLLKSIDKYDKSLLVTHRGVINMIYVLLNDHELTMDKRRYGVEHASVHELDIVKKKIRRVW